MESNATTNLSTIINSHSPTIYYSLRDSYQKTTSPVTSHPKTILEVLQYTNRNQTANMSSAARQSTIYTIPSVSDTKNPIEFTSEEVKMCSKWKKYVKKIHTLIIDEIPHICLVKKTNNCYQYESNIPSTSSKPQQQRKVIFECRYEGIPGRQKCTCVVYENNAKIFHKTKKTPKRLYINLCDFIDMEYAYTFVSIASSPLTQYAMKAHIHKRETGGYVSPTAMDIDTFYVSTNKNTK